MPKTATLAAGALTTAVLVGFVAPTAASASAYNSSTNSSTGAFTTVNATAAAASHQQQAAPLVSPPFECGPEHDGATWQDPSTGKWYICRNTGSIWFWHEM